MKLFRRAAGFVLAGLLMIGALAREGRRAQPFNDPPLPRALPVDEAPPGLEDRPSTPEQPNDKRQLEYANALFARKMYDLAIPEYEKYLNDYGGASRRAHAHFWFCGSQCLFWIRLKLSLTREEWFRPHQLSKSARRFWGQRICRSSSLCSSRSCFLAKGFHCRTTALSQSSRKIEGRLGCVIGQIF